MTISAAQSDAIDVLSVGAADSLAVVFAVEAAATIADMDLSDIETVSIDVGADDTVTFTALNLDGVTALTITGSGVIDMDAATANSLETVDLSAFTGDFDIDVEDSDGVEVIIGNLTGDSVLTLDAANATIDTVTFVGGELDFDIAVEGFEAGIGGDVIDLSAFGVTGLADLTFTDAGADTTIEIDGIDGVITLTGVAAPANLDASNFIFA